MATNQVIHGSNRVVENPNRYKLNAVSGQANTYDLEKVPGTITDNGTPYSKSILDKIDNVLSYLTPSVEKNTTKLLNSNPNVERISPSWNGQTNIGKSINIEYQPFPNTQIVPKIKISPRNSADTISSFELTGTIARIFSKNNNNDDFTSQHIIDILNSRSQTLSSNNSLRIIPCTSSAGARRYVDMLIDLQSTNNDVIMKINAYCLNSNVYMKLYGGNSYDVAGTSNLVVSNLATDSMKTITLGQYKYYRIEIQGNTSGDAAMIYALYFENLEKTITSNKFTLDNNSQSGFTNNQRVLVEAPSTTDLTGVESNTLNGVNISTLLQPSTKYELIYKEDEDKFALGNLTDRKPIVDITLTEFAREIELGALPLENSKNYILNIKSVTNSGSSNMSNTLLDGSGNVLASLLTAMGTTAINCALWTSNDITNNSNFKIQNNVGLDYQAGTRIIIVEVA